jgi:hypothetical protein
VGLAAPTAADTAGAAAVADAAGAATAADLAAAGPGARTTALLLFVSYRGILVHSLDPTWVRLTSSAALAGSLAEPAHPVVTYPEVEPLLRSRGVRSERDIDDGLLEALARDFSADRLVVCTVTMHRDRIHLLARGLRTDTGSLAWVDVAEAPVPEDPSENVPDRIRTILEGAARALRPEWSTSAPAGATALVVLPIKSEGTERSLADLVTSCFARSLIARQRWVVPDPMLAASALREGGFHPLRLEEGSRRLLAERFGAKLLLAPRLVRFPLPDGDAWAPAADEDGNGALSFELGTGVPYLLSLALIDCESGKVIDGGDVYLAPESGTGIFGVARRSLAARRFERGADRAIASVFDKGGKHE